QVAGAQLRTTDPLRLRHLVASGVVQPDTGRGPRGQRQTRAVKSGSGARPHVRSADQATRLRRRDPTRPAGVLHRTRDRLQRPAPPPPGPVSYLPQLLQLGDLVLDLLLLRRQVSILLGLLRDEIVERLLVTGVLVPCESHVADLLALAAGDHVE